MNEIDFSKIEKNLKELSIYFHPQLPVSEMILINEFIVSAQ